MKNYKAQSKITPNATPTNKGARQLPAGDKKYPMFRLYLLILTVGVILFISFSIFCATHPELEIHKVNLFFSSGDKYMDFFNPFFGSRNLDTYIGEYSSGSQPSASSPFFQVICHFINKAFPGLSGERYEIRFTPTGQLIFLVYISISLLIFGIAFSGLFKKFSVNTKSRIWFYLMFLLSYPVLFALDRGNVAFLAGGIIALFFIQYINGKTFSAALLLAVAIALKYYYGVFIIFFIVDKKWRDATICAVSACVLLLASLALFEGGLFLNLSILLHNIVNYNSAGQPKIAESLGYSTSIYMLFDVPYCAVKNIFGMGSELLTALNNKVKILAYLILLISAFLSCLPNLKKHDRLLLLTAGMLLFPLLSNDYIIPVIFFPSVYWILSEPNDRVMPWLAGLYIVFKRYIIFYNIKYVMSVTIQSIINPLILLLILGYIIWLRREIIMGYFSVAKNRKTL